LRRPVEFVILRLMYRRRHQKTNARHWGVLVNTKAAGYSRSVVDLVLKAIKAQGGFYTLVEPDSSSTMLQQALVLAGQVKGESGPNEAQFGKITGLIAVGGDGTFNLVARAALEADMPVGLVPIGRFNNVARSVYADPKPSAVVSRVLEGNYRKLDVGMVGDRPFFCSVGLGLIPELAAALEGKRTPVFGIGWARLASAAAAKVTVHKTLLKVDAVKFDFTPIVLNVNLLSYAVGLPFSPASVPDDGLLEVLCDQQPLVGQYSAFVRQIFKGKYLYGKEISLYRGHTVLCQPTRGRTLYVDGELIKLQTNSLEVSLNAKQLMLLG
jgi:diacylglycerol kinase (ATP)